MAGNISSMGSTLKRMHADIASPTNAKRQKTRTSRRDELSDDASGDESADSADSNGLLQVTRALQEPAPPKSLSKVEDPSTSFLGNISQDCHAEEKTTEAVTAKLAEFVNKRFSAKPDDGKYNEKLDKNGRPSNRDKVAVPTVNPEIWDKLAHQAKRRDLHVAAIQKAVTKVGTILTGSASKIMATLAESKNSNITSNLEELLTFSTDAIELLGHSNQSLSQHRRDLIRPCLNKEYSALCSPHIPITGKLFGDELQSLLNSVKASNKIGNLAAGVSSRRFHDKPGNNNKSGKPSLGQRGKKPHYARKNSGRKRSSDCKLFTERFVWPGRYRQFCNSYPCSSHYFTLRADCFKAGQLVDCVDNWKLITTDQEILSIVQGQHIEFHSIHF